MLPLLLPSILQSGAYKDRVHKDRVQFGTGRDQNRVPEFYRAQFPFVVGRPPMIHLGR